MRQLIDGRPEERVSLAPFGGGLNHGVGLIETLPVVRGCPILFAEHMTRLFDGARRLGLPTPPSEDALADDIATLVRAGSLGDAFTLRILCVLDESRLVRVVRAAAATERGKPLILGPAAPLFGGPRALAAVKSTGGWITSRLALEEGRRRGLDEVYLVDSRGSVLEGARSNVFVVQPDGSVATPKADGRLLDGIVRRTILRLAQGLGIKTKERALTSVDISGARAVFLTSSLLGVACVRPIPPEEDPIVAALAQALFDVEDPS